MTASISDLGYLAGVIDSEGCIGAYLQGYTPKQARRLPALLLKVAIAVTDAAFMEAISDLVHSLGINKEAKFYPSSHCRQGGYFQLLIQSKTDIRTLLTAVYPYLRLKRAQAELMLKIVNTPVAQGRRPGGSYNATPPELYEYAKQIQALNQRSTPSQTDREISPAVGVETRTPLEREGIVHPAAC